MDVGRQIHEAVSKSAAYVRLRTFALVAIPLLMQTIFTVVYVPWRQQSALIASEQEKARVMALTLAVNLAPVVEFDPSALNERLALVAKDPAIVYMRVTGENDNQRLASYGSDTGFVAKAALTQPFELIAEDEASFQVVARIQKGNVTLGALQIGFSKEQSLAAASGFRITAILLALTVFIAAAGIALLLSRGFTRLFEQLRASLLQTARRVDESVSRLAAVTAEQTSAAAEESTALMQTNASAASLSSSATSSAGRATALIEGGSRAEAEATSTQNAVDTASGAMRDVRDQMSRIATVIGALSDRAAAIGDIASTVALLAERSNLLALNAAIEAARAGSQGRGFSVVANEMRALADGSHRSAGQVKTIIAEIHAAISNAVGEVREGERRVQNAETMTAEASAGIKSFARSMHDFVGLGTEIAGTAKEQSAAIEQMVESIAHATQAGSAQLETTKQVEDTAQQLRRLSLELLQLLSRKGAVEVEPIDTSAMDAVQTVARLRP